MPRSLCTCPLRFVYLFVALVAALLLPARSFAIGQPQYVAGTATPGSFALAQNGRAAPIWVESGDWAGVRRAAHDLQSDVQRVTGSEPGLSDSPQPPAREVV